MTDLSNIKQIIAEKSVLKQDIFELLKHHFELFRVKTSDLSKNLHDWAASIDKRIKINFDEKNIYEFWLQVGGDLLIFTMHTNIFTYDKSHSIYKSKYIQDDPNRSYFGMIEIYNYLNDSYKYQRLNDMGELIGRIFINKDHHFFVEGDGTLGFLYSDLSILKMDESYVNAIIETAIMNSIEYDLKVPPYNDVKYVPLGFMLNKSGSTPHATSKRLGFEIKNLNTNDDIV
jgi:hypothetical protein